MLADLIARSRTTGGELALYNRVLTALRMEARMAAGSHLPVLESIEDVIHEAREAVATAMQHDQAIQRWAVTGWANRLRDASLSLSEVRTLSGLGAVLPEHLTKLGFQRAYIALHEADPQFSRLVFGWARDQPLEASTPVPFRTQALVPPGFIADDEGGNWVVLPLAASKRRFGHLVLDFGAGVGVVWETLCQQLALTLELCRVV